MTPPDEPPLLHLIAGINGAGKTSFYHDFLRQRTPDAELVNADEIERLQWPDTVGQHSYEAAQQAARRREELIAEGVSFVTEAVFSHPSKLELIERARTAGFIVVLYHIHVSSPELALHRVRTRVSDGGHDVPAEKVITRYPRVVQLVRKAVEQAHRAYLYDNSRLDHGFTHVVTFERGRVQNLGVYVPRWVEEIYGELISRYRAESTRAT